MNCFFYNNNKLLVCRSCNQTFSLSEEHFPEDLFSLLLRYNIPQIHWYCKACNTAKVTPKSFEDLDRRIAFLETNFAVVKQRFPETNRDIADNNVPSIPAYPIQDMFGKNVPLYVADPTPVQNGSLTPKSGHSIGTPDSSPININREAGKILTKIISTEITIDKSEALQSISVIDAFILEINPFLKKEDPVFKYMYSRDYKTGSSYNDLKISSANEYDINIMFLLPEPFKLEVEFFEETKVFAKIKWSVTKSFREIPESKICILKFLEKQSVDGYLDPSKVKAWFQGLVEKFCFSKPKIKGIRKFINSQSGPARTIEITTENNFELSLDLVPVFVFSFDIFTKNEFPRLSEYDLENTKKFCSFVPKVCDGEEKLLASDCKLSWRIYIPEIDKRMFYKMKCSKPIVKLLKLLRDKHDWKSLASYHLATVILWEIKDSNSDEDKWLDNMFYERFLKSLERLQMCLKEKCLPYFLYPQYNLFHSLNKDECENLSNRIKNMIKKISSDYEYLNTIFTKKT